MGRARVRQHVQPARVELGPASLVSDRLCGSRRGSLLRYASQHVFDRVGKGRKPNYNKQVRQGTTQESVVPVGLLEACEVRPGSRHVPVEKRKPVLAVVRLPVRNHVR